jgi:hypothetical protein
MSFSRALVFALVAALVAPQAFAQDDLLVPMPKASKSAKRRPPAKKSAAAKKSESTPADDDLVVPVPSKKPATVKKTEPAPADDDLLVPAPAKKPATAKKVEPVPSDDDLIVPLVPGKGELAVKLAGGVKGARLFVDNKDVGALPLAAPLSLAAGEHILIVRRLGFSDYTRRVTLQQGKPSEVSVTLEAVAGVVGVTSDVPGSTVTINGQPKGAAPLSNVLLKPGAYELVVSKEGFEPETKTLLVKAGKDYTVAASLRPAEKAPAVASTDRPERPVLTPTDSTVKPMGPLTQREPEVSTRQPWFKRWYVWAGVGVVAAAAVGTVVATQGGAKPLDGPAVCGGPCDGTINGVVRLPGR